jgi:hypothetical protein
MPIGERIVELARLVTAMHLDLVLEGSSIEETAGGAGRNALGGTDVPAPGGAGAEANGGTEAATGGAGSTR